MRRWLAWLPASRLAVLAAGLAVVSIGAFAATALLRDAGPASGVMELDGEGSDLAALLDQHGVLDSDRDGLADAVENLVYGSDPNRWNTSGGPVPDGWLARNGYDPNDPQAALRPATSPPTEKLPEAYGNRWPDRFTLTLGAAYAFGRPLDWNEAADGPYDSGIDPRDWDQDDDGIPDGWLVHHGIDPRTPNVSAQQLAGPAGLTVFEAFRHGTDPRSLDSDLDGLADRDELAGAANPRPVGPPRFPPSDPARADTAGAGVCDGYLVRHGLDPTDPKSSLADLDHDGATTRDEAMWSANHTAQHCKAGGLDPTDAQTADAGIPDGWLISHGLDPLVAGVAAQKTQAADTDPRPSGVPAPASALVLTVLDEYEYARPPNWDEARSGPWLGGTDPASNDTDKDGLGDAWEMAGVRLRVAAEPSQPDGLEYAATFDPTRADGDGDGLLDADEALAGTDGRRPDTDFDGLADGEEAKLALGLDLKRADSTSAPGRTGDLLRDGERLSLLTQRAADALAGTPYPYPGPPGAPRPVTAWAASLPGAAKLGGSPTTAQLAALLGPTGDADDDGVPNIRDEDIDADGIVNGPEIDPREYAGTRFGLGPLGSRAATDPLNRDTDGDLLRDDWEVEHGILQDGLLTLDPASWDSDGDCAAADASLCRNDGAEDPDEDGLAWPRFVAKAGIPTLQNVSVPFTNVREQAASTDPNTPETDGDGLSDGWKAFWGIDYPLIPRTASQLGLYFPQSVPDAPRPSPGTLQAEGTPSALVVLRPYWRSVVDGAPLSAAFDEHFTGMVTPVQRIDGAIQVANVTGTVRLDYQDVQALGTNPYLEDTDGDGLPDWWEFLHAAPLPGMPASAGCVQGGLDPLKHEPTADPDGDGLDNLGEFQAKTDPLCKDSDLGGVPDGEEWLRSASGGRLDPTKPGDDKSLLDANIDQDLDGAPDFDEITKLQTRYDHPDTDGDGMLDGPTLPTDGSCWRPLAGPDSSATQRALRLLDLGIAYEVRSGDCYFFLGEGDVNIMTDPRNGDDYGAGVPTGWIWMKMAAYSSSDAGRALENYQLGKPDWWAEAVHGPWWGGADPQTSPDRDDIPYEPLGDMRNRRDLDGDGLRDRDATGAPSEDPFPTGNAANVLRPVAGAPTLPDPLDEGSPDLERRLAAQASLNPAPYSINRRNAIPHPLPGSETRSLPCLAVDEVPAKLLKGDPAPIEGLLTQRAPDGTCTSTGIAGIAIEGVLAGRTFAADFTAPDGAFRFDLNVSSSARTLQVPTGAASAFQGRLAGNVTWVPAGSAVEVGQRVLTVRSSATSSWQAVEATAPIEVHAGAVITLDAPDETRTGRPVPIRVVLRDTSGAPLRDPVKVLWLGDETVVQPDGEGRADATLPGVPADDAGNATLLLRSVPSSSFVKVAEASVKVSARRPGVLELPDAPGTDAGSKVVVRGQYRDLWADRSEIGVSGAKVDVMVALPTGPLSARVTTDSGGRFEATFEIPANTPPGTHLVRAVTIGTPASAPASDEADLAVRARPHFDQVLASPLLAQESHLVTARLVDAVGRAIPQASVVVTLGSTKAPAVTDEDGIAGVTLKVDLKPGPVKQTLAFEGNADYAPATHVLQRMVASKTLVELPSGTLARGAVAQVPVRLTDGNGAPVSGAPITVVWGAEDPRQVLTNAHGVATFMRPAPDAERLGVILVQARYPGSGSSGLGASNASQAWNVIAQAEFKFPTQPAVAGGPAPSATLIDAGTGAPLAHRSVTRGAGNASALLTTDAQGRIPLLAAPARDAEPATLKVPVRFAGDADFPGVQGLAVVRIVSPAQMSAQVPAQLTTGKVALVHAHLSDGRGEAPSGGRVQLAWGGAILADQAVVGSPVQLAISLPANATPGAAALTFRYSGSDTHSPTDAVAATQVVRGASLTVAADAAKTGGTAILRVTMAAGDVPLADRKLVLILEGTATGLEATTDENGVATFSLVQTHDQMGFLVRAAGDAEVAPASTAGLLQAVAPRTVTDKGVGSLAWGAAGLAAAVVSTMLIALRGRDPLDAALYRARRALQARGPEERRVLEAYRALEDAAIAMEILAHPAETPRTLEEVLRPRLPASAAPALGRLMDAFEAARYGQAPIGAAQRQAALSSLGAVQAALHGGRS